jgi:hypothetical protein
MSKIERDFDISAILFIPFPKVTNSELGGRFHSRTKGFLDSDGKRFGLKGFVALAWNDSDIEVLWSSLASTFKAPNLSNA